MSAGQYLELIVEIWPQARVVTVGANNDAGGGCGTWSVVGSHQEWSRPPTAALNTERVQRALGWQMRLLNEPDDLQLLG